MLNAYWVAGLTSGDGGFFVQITESIRHKLGLRVRLRYEITQDERDKQLMSMLITFFGCGSLYQSGTTVKYCVLGFLDIITIIIPFFSKYQVSGVKYLN